MTGCENVITTSHLEASGANPKTFINFGASKRDRTADLGFTRASLYQLSYAGRLVREDSSKSFKIQQL